MSERISVPFCTKHQVSTVLPQSSSREDIMRDIDFRNECERQHIYVDEWMSSQTCPRCRSRLPKTIEYIQANAIKTGNSQDGKHLDLQVVVVVVAVAVWYLDNTLVVHMRQAYMGQLPFLHSKAVAVAAVGIADLDTMEVAEYWMIVLPVPYVRHQTTHQ